MTITGASPHAPREDARARRRWLEVVAGVCERVVATDLGPAPEPYHAALVKDVAAVLARVRAELDAPVRDDEQRGARRSGISP